MTDEEFIDTIVMTINLCYQFLLFQQKIQLVLSYDTNSLHKFMKFFFSAFTVHYHVAHLVFHYLPY